MIRPFTVLCFLLACGSGLWLYQSKHRVQMLDRQIEQTVHATEAMRDQARLLNAEWMLLNDPDRLRALADQFLTLQTVKPTQFTTMAELDHRLPPVRSPDAPLEPVPEPAVMTPMVPPPMAQAAPNPVPDRTPATTPPAAVATAAPAETPAAQPPPHAAAPAVLADRKPPDRAPDHPAPPRVVMATPHPPGEPHDRVIAQATPRPMPVVARRYSAPVAPVAAPITGGSALGMASQGGLPPPQPIAPKPISLFQASDH